MSPAPKKPEASGQIELVRLTKRTIVVPIEGITPFIAHRWPEKAREMMRVKQMSENPVKAKREAKNPEQEAHDSTYWLVPGEIPGAPAPAFKVALVDAARSFAGLTMVQAKTMFFVRGEGPEQLVRLLDAEWGMHEDLPRNANGNPDLRYRNYVFPWRANLEVTFKESLISSQSVLALVEEAGSMGIGDWRPSSPKSASGIYGQWVIDTSREVQVL